MHLLLSGEGPSDIGVCYPAAEYCQSENFKPGPMAWLVDQWIEKCQGYDFSHLESGLVHFVNEKYLAKNKPDPAKKAMRLRGKRTPGETAYYFYNARALAKRAISLAHEVDDQVVAVLFRDADGTASAGRGEWQAKYDSMLEGFEVEGFVYGVAMLPQPKSEAWLLCALNPQSPYQHCARLEEESGNDKSPYSLKSQLDVACQGNTSADQLAETVKTGGIQWEKIDMPSLSAFKSRLEEVVARAVKRKTQCKQQIQKASIKEQQ